MVVESRKLADLLVTPFFPAGPGTAMHEIWKGQSGFLANRSYVGEK